MDFWMKGWWEEAVGCYVQRSGTTSSFPSSAYFPTSSPSNTSDGTTHQQAQPEFDYVGEAPSCRCSSRYLLDPGEMGKRCVRSRMRAVGHWPPRKVIPAEKTSVSGVVIYWEGEGEYDGVGRERRRMR